MLRWVKGKNSPMKNRPQNVGPEDNGGRGILKKIKTPQVFYKK